MTDYCRVCKQPVPDAFYEVVLRNKMIVTACLECWMKWPDEWKSVSAAQLEGV